MSFCRGNLTRVTQLTLLLKTSVSPDKYQKIPPCKGIHDSLWILLRGFLIPDSWFQVPNSCFFVIGTIVSGIRNPWAVFRIPKPRILDSTSKNFPDSLEDENEQKYANKKIIPYWDNLFISPYYVVFMLMLTVQWAANPAQNVAI